jgi:transcriptional regulator with XRE-family HTH domain
MQEICCILIQIIYRWLMDPAELKKRREALGLTMDALSGAIGVSKATYANWEHGRANPSKAARQRLDECMRSLEKSGTIDLRLPIDPELRKALEVKAKKQGLTVEELAVKILGLSGLILLLAAIIGGLALLGAGLPLAESLSLGIGMPGNTQSAAAGPDPLDWAE